VTPTVGFTGWAIHGGYGLLSTNYGLGSDQIVGARVVDGQGNIVDADETLLTAIRGGGGSVAVIYELVIKVYPSEKVR
jgi:FAD/FMN-containing dehydrogenase